MKKSKDDFHVLNWTQITKSSLNEKVQVNENIDNSHKVNKGILFEDIIEKLLLAMFPKEIWKRTGESHDGKRDFVYPAEAYLREQKWAECKNYSSNLSINILAPTLIMGAIKNIKCIYFFSYSPLNDTAVENLLRYADMQKTVIKIFDGSLLETLICRYHAVNDIGKFFPGTDFNRAYKELEQKQIHIIRTLYGLNGNKISPTHRFELGESFYFYIIVQNIVQESVDLEISFQASRQKIIHCKSASCKASLPFAEIKSFSFLCEALNPGSTSCTVKIIINDKAKRICQRVTVVDEPYLAWAGEKALASLEEGLCHFINKSPEPLFILGESGTGKSTLTEILLCDKRIQEYYRILKIDLSLTRSSCMRSLFSQIWGMTGKETTPKDQIEDDETALSLLISNYAESADTIVDILMDFYNSEHPYLFVVDDIQKISRPYISLFQELDNRAYKRNYPVYYLFVLNEADTSLHELLSSMNWDRHYQNRKYQVIRTSKFGQNDILAYLKTRYGLENIDGYFDAIKKEISPLELHSFCNGLKKERVIAQVPGRKTYQIVNPFKFSEGIQHLLYDEIPFRNVCSLFDKGGQAEFLLKYLYIADAFSPRMEEDYAYILQGLIEYGILKEKDGTITFYHDKIRTFLGETMVFSPEDYADIFVASDTDDAAKAICALEQIGSLRNGGTFLRNFFSSTVHLRKGAQRYQICELIFEHLEELANINLLSSALRFVSLQFAALKDEQGHKTFFCFLKCIADSALNNTWDIDEICTENMALFIKKFFDRALSTYNHQICLTYFQKYEMIFNSLKHISNSRRYFWLSHYANRAAIALDRESVPLIAESMKATELYELSEFYSAQAGNQELLTLQITVDNFNRHYVYRHNLTADIIHDTYGKLLHLKENGRINSMVLDYHILLLEYLRIQTVLSEKHNICELLNRIHDTRLGSTSAFYIMKLYLLEIMIFMNLHNWDKASEYLTEAYEFAYNKEMRSYVYKLTYIKTQLTVFKKQSLDSEIVYQQAFLALEQMMDIHGNTMQNLKREVFLLARLMQIIAKHKSNEITDIISCYNEEIKGLLNKCFLLSQGKYNEMNELLLMQSYFIVDGISFPTV